MYVCAYIYIYIWRSRLCSRKLFFDHRNPTKTHTTLLRASSPPMMRRPKIKRALRHRDDADATTPNTRTSTSQGREASLS